MKKFLVTIILFVTMVLSNWAASSYNAMLPSTGRDFWLTYMYNYAQPASAVELQLYAIAEDATTITVTAADGTVLVSGQPIAAGGSFIYTIPAGEAAKVYNTGTDITETKGLHVTSTSADIALYMRNGYADGDLSFDMSPVFATPTLGKEYMVQTYIRDMDRTEMAIVATEDGTQVKIVTGNEALKHDGTIYSPGQTINLAMNAGEVYQLKGTTYDRYTHPDCSLTGTTIQANKKVAVFNGGSKATVPNNTGANGDHLCEQSIPVEAWGKRFVLQEMNGFPGTEEEEVSSMPTEYYITAIYGNTEVKINGATKTTLQKGESYKVTVKYTDFPKLAETSMPAICYGYMTNGATNNYDGQLYGEPSMTLIPAIEKGVNKATLYAPKFDDPAATDIVHYANVTVPSTGTSTMMLNGVNVGNLFTTISGGLAYARLTLAEGVNVLSNTECRFVAVAYDIEPDLAVSEAYATTINMVSAAPRVYIDNQLVDDGTELEWCNNHPGINFRAEIDYPHDSVRWTFGDGQSSTSTTEQHEYQLQIAGQKETNHVAFYVFHHTPLAHEDKVDTVRIELTVHPTYYFPEEVVPICGKENSYYWANGDTTFTFNKSTNQTITYSKNYGTTIYGCDSIYSLRLIVHPEVFGDTAASVCRADLPYAWHGKTVNTDGGTLVDTLSNQFGCDSIVTLTLHVLEATSSEFSAENCNSYTWNGVSYTTSGDHIQHFTNKVGCDSTVTMHLTIYNDVTSDTTAVACDSFPWHGNEYTTSGDKIWHGTTVHGCDSAVTLHLTIKHSSTPTEFSMTACETYTWEDTDLPELTTSGDYQHTFTNVAGCDSLVTLHLDIKHNATSEFYAADCDRYTWDGTEYTTSGNYQKHYTIAAGCDSTVTMHLTIYNSTTGDTTATACDNFTWHGTTYTTSCEPTHTYQTIHGCDSVVTLHLTINKSYHVDTTAVECESFTWHGITYTSTPAENPVYSTHTVAGCDSIVTLHLTIQTPHTEPTVKSICEGEQFVWNYSPLGTYNGQAFETETHLADTISCGEIYTLDLTILRRPEVTSIAMQGGVNQCLEQNATLLYQASSNATTYTYAIYGDGVIIPGGDDNDDDDDDDMQLPPHPHAPHRAGALTTGSGSISGGSIELNTSTLSAGTYEVRFVVKSANCESDTARVPFTILAVKDSVINDTICYDGSLLWFGTYYNAAGTYTHTDQYTNGCDSVRYTLNLTRLNVKEEEAEPQSVCKESLPYIWRGKEYMTSGTYRDTIYYRNGCDSVHYTLDLQVQEIDTIQPPVSATVCKGNFYSWDGVNIDTDTLTVGTHDFYSPVATAIGECLREVKHLVLTVQAVPTPTEIPASACQTYTWNGTTYTESGDYTYTHKVGSCDVTDILHLTIGEPWETPLDSTIHPQNVPFTWNEFGVTFPNVSTPGTYTQDKTYKTVGTLCDSTYHLTLIVTNKIDSTLRDTICQGDTYSWRGTDYNTTGVYTDDTTNPDTTFILNLTVQSLKEKPATKHVCDATSFTWTLADGTNAGTFTHEGDYEYTQHYTTGCDSVLHTLHLTFGTSNTGEDRDTVCAGKFYTYNNTTITTQYGHDFHYEKTLTNASGCDSVVTVYVHVARSDKSEFPAEACGQYEWEGTTYTTSGDYTHTYTNEEGCDSVVTLHLTIHNVLNELIEGGELNEGEEYLWHRGLNGDTTITTAGFYYDRNTSVYGCDSTYILHVQYTKAERDTIDDTACDSYVWGGHTYTESGLYGDTVWSADHKSYEAIHYVRLTVYHSLRNELPAETICQGETVTINGETLTPAATGWQRVEKSTDDGCPRVDSMYVTVKTVTELPTDSTVCQTELPFEWHHRMIHASGTYGDTLRYPISGCDSIRYTLNLTVNTITPHRYDTLTKCQLSTFEWEGMPFDCHELPVGEYDYHISNVQIPGECDTTGMSLHLKIFSNDPIVIDTAICHGESFDWYVEGDLRIKNITETCIQHDTIHDDDCDRIYELHLTVYDEVKPRDFGVITLCGTDEPYAWRGQMLSRSGVYYDTLPGMAANGCDSIYMIRIDRLTPDTIDEHLTVCEGEEFTWRSHTIPAEEMQAGTIERYETLAPAAPATCPTVAHLVLNVTRPLVDEQDVIACGSYLWHGRTYTTDANDTIIGYATEGCDTTYILHLTMGQAFEQSDAAVVRPSQLPYTMHHTTFTEAGTKTEEWKSVNGCDSIWHLTLTVSELTPDTILAAICQGDDYTWAQNGRTYTTGGTYTTKVDDQPYVLILTVNPTYTQHVYKSVCETSFGWHGNTYTASGDYTWSGKTTQDCDSIEILHLTLLDPTPQNESRSACPGQSITWGEQSYIAVAGETKTLFRERQLTADCTVTDELTLTVGHNVSGEETVTECDSYLWNGTSYTHSGDYTATLPAANGCDSVATLHLTIHSSFLNEEDVEISEDALPYRWTGHKGDTAIYTGGDYYERLHTVDGCDSIYHLHLHVGFVTRDTAYNEECDELEWDNGIIYTESGFYTDTVWNADHSDYDAIHYLDLTLGHTSTAEWPAATFCEGETITWFGVDYTPSAGDTIFEKKMYTIHGCDSILTWPVTVRSKFGTRLEEEVCPSHLPYIWHGRALTEANTYYDTLTSVLTGCDSIETLVLTFSTQSEGQVEEMEMCDLNTITWRDLTITKPEPGEYTYYYRYLIDGECDSIIDQLNLTVLHHEPDTTHALVCYGSNYTWEPEAGQVLYFGQNLVNDAEIVDTIADPLCDKIYVLDLKVLGASTTVETDTTICEGSSVLWPINGKTYSQAGRHTDTVASLISGCDSIIRVLNIHINTLTVVEDTETLCEGSSYTFMGKTYSNLAIGQYHWEDTIRYAEGCDSLITVMDLTVTEQPVVEQTIVTCGEYEWEDVNRTYRNLSNAVGAETKIYDDTVLIQGATDNCATKYILHLTLHPTYEIFADTVVRKLPVIYKGVVFNEPGDSIVKKHASTTCDSIYHLGVVLSDRELKTETVTMCEGNTYTWRGNDYTVAGTYVNDDADPDTTFTLILNVTPLDVHTETVTTCDGHYVWQGQDLTLSGTYTDTLPAIGGSVDACGSVEVLNLTVLPTQPLSEKYTLCRNALPYNWVGKGMFMVYGNDTTIHTERTIAACGATVTDTLRLTILETSASESEYTTCSNEPYLWNGLSYNTTGDYTFTTPNAVGCDSVATLHLTVLDAFVNEEHIESVNVPYIWRGQSLSEEGWYADSLTRVENGCDSVYRVHFHPNIAERDTTTEAECGEYTWRGTTYTESGEVRDTVWNADHTNYTVSLLYLTIWPKYDYTSEEDTSILAGETYLWHGQTYSTTGDYTYMITTTHGCDSVLATLHLVVGDPIIEDIYVEACENEGYEFKGQIYTTSTELRDTTKTAEGLDSVTVTHLTIWPVVTYVQDTTVCEQFEWNGIILTESGDYEVTLSTSQHGCDSINKLHVTIVDSIIFVPNKEMLIDTLGYCPGDTAYIPYNLLRGDPTAYKIFFRESALEQGFENVEEYESLNGHSDIAIAIPEDCEAGAYEAELQLTDYISESRVAIFRFYVALDGVLHTMWNDVLAVDNSKGRFFEYRWYLGDNEILGATKQYYNQGTPLQGVYRARVLLRDGRWVFTCPLDVDMTNVPLQLLASPCPAVHGQPVDLTILGADEETLANGTLRVYSASGQLIYSKLGAERTQQVDFVSGEYIAIFRTKDNRSVNVKFLVH